MDQRLTLRVLEEEVQGPIPSRTSLGNELFEIGYGLGVQGSRPESVALLLIVQEFSLLETK